MLAYIPYMDPMGDGSMEKSHDEKNHPSPYGPTTHFGSAPLGGQLAPPPEARDGYLLIIYYIYISNYLSNYLSDSICLHICLSAYLPAYLPSFLPSYLSIYLAI